jgi:hypothetical protein
MLCGRIRVAPDVELIRRLERLGQLGPVRGAGLLAAHSSPASPDPSSGLGYCTPLEVRATWDDPFRLQKHAA